jgi:ATP-binding cassette subfamily C exporter for protease/lipase
LSAREGADKIVHGSDNAARVTAQIAQVSALGLGAALVSQSALSAGGMIGASLIVAKFVGSVDALIGQWSALGTAREAIAALLRAEKMTDQPTRTQIRNLSGKLVANSLIIPRGGGARPILDRVSVSLEAGECLAVLGSSGSGKTRLMHALCGAQPADIGAVLLDDTDVRTLDEATFSQQIGYLPQCAGLFAGSLAQNIARFDPDIKG